MEEQPAKITETVAAEQAKADEAAPPAPKISTAQRKKMRQQQANFAKMFKSFNERKAAERRQLREEADRYRLMLGKEDFKSLRDICTIHTPEQKNEKGEVAAKAAHFFNRKAFITEAKLVLALKREQRIVAKGRKRSTGNSSARKMHRSTMDFIHRRDQETLEKETLKS